jgi:hypothetical protein
LEEIEATETGCASSRGLASVARIGTVGADSTSGSDDGVGASGTVVERCASSASRTTGNTSLLGIIEELVAEAAFLANGSGSDVSSGAFQTVLRSVLAAVAAGRAVNADA